MRDIAFDISSTKSTDSDPRRLAILGASNVQQHTSLLRRLPHRLPSRARSIVTFFETKTIYMRIAYMKEQLRLRQPGLPLSPDVAGALGNPRGLFGAPTIAFVRSLGVGVIRYGLVFLLLAGGASKFAAFEAEGIRPFIEHSPVMSWLYSALSVRAASGAIGVIEIALSVGIALRRWSPVVSGIASLAAAGMFIVTWSFFFTTPGAMAPGSDVGGFLMKDLILLGGALAVAAEALGAARERASIDSLGKEPSA